MRHRTFILATAAAALLAACGGGGGGNGFTPSGGGPPPVGAGNIPIQESVAGTMAWVDPTTHFTLYYLDTDTANGGGCTAGCSTVWPVMATSANATAAGNMLIITRADASMQWSYSGHPLYHFSGDNGPDQNHGVYGPWHMAVPNPNGTPPPGGPPCKSYC